MIGAIIKGGRWAVVSTVSQRGLSVINSNINIYIFQIYVELLYIHGCE